LLQQYSYLSEDKEKSREKIAVDHKLMLWHEDKCLESETRSLAMLALDTVGEELVMEDNSCSISFEKNGDPATYLEPDSGSLLYYRDGQFRKVKKVKVPANVIAGAAARAKQGWRDPNKTIRPKQKSIEFAACVFCTKQGHAVYQCEAFIKAPMKTKLATVKENKLCFRCLNKNHQAKECKVKFLCDVDGCGKRHHRLLHPPGIPTKGYYAQVAQQGLGSDISDCESDD
jgi:hypothetical protein